MERLDRLFGEERTIVVETSSEEETRSLGEKFGGLAPAGTTVSLQGDLGAGKTVIAGGIAAGLGIDSEVLSPTFILVEEYAGGRLPLLHFDLYRLEELGEVERIGLFDAVDGRNVVLVEWGDRLPGGSMDFDAVIDIETTRDGGRRIAISGPSSLIAAIEREVGA